MCFFLYRDDTHFDNLYTLIEFKIDCWRNKPRLVEEVRTVLTWMYNGLRLHLHFHRWVSLENKYSIHHLLHTGFHNISFGSPCYSDSETKYGYEQDDR